MNKSPRACCTSSKVALPLCRLQIFGQADCGCNSTSVDANHEAIYVALSLHRAAIRPTFTYAPRSYSYIYLTSVHWSNDAFENCSNKSSEEGKRHHRYPFKVHVLVSLYTACAFSHQAVVLLIFHNIILSAFCLLLIVDSRLTGRERVMTLGICVFLCVFAKADNTVFQNCHKHIFLISAFRI